MILQTSHFFQFSFILSPVTTLWLFSGEVKAQNHLVRVSKTTCSGLKYIGWKLQTWLQLARLPINTIWLLSPQTHLEIVSRSPWEYSGVPHCEDTTTQAWSLASGSAASCTPPPDMEVKCLLKCQYTNNIHLKLFFFFLFFFKCVG